MSLRSLVGESLETVTPSGRTIRRLLEGADRHIADAKVSAVSAETRLASAYTAIRMLADAGLNAHGLRVRTSVPGHHRTAIQALRHTLGLDARTIARLDALRRLRNLAEHSGDTVPETAVAECVAQAVSIRVAAVEWPAANRPELSDGE